jgi:NitT/TauT family transport system ATP-binding protein
MLGPELRRTATRAARERARFLLGSLGVAEYEERGVGSLPPGVAERVALCRALVHRPALLLLDEPFRNVDSLTREGLWLDLQRLWSEEKFGVVLATSDVAEAVHLGDRVAVLGQKAGEILKIVQVDLPRPRRMSKGMTPLLAEYGDAIRTIVRADGAIP